MAEASFEHRDLSTPNPTLSPRATLARQQSHEPLLPIQVQSLKQTETLLNQDKEYFSKQVVDHQNRAMYADEKVQQLSNELELAKRAREDMYEKYANSR